jgi:hypothetical protein
MAMSTGQESDPQVDDPETVKAKWLKCLNDLASQVKNWVEPRGWRTRLVAKPTRDSFLGRFEVPLLLMERDGVEVALNPVSRFVTGSDGAVDLYVVPAYDEVASLYLADGRWTLYHASDQAEAGKNGEAEAMPLSESTVNRVLDEMVVLDE